MRCVVLGSNSFAGSGFVHHALSHGHAVTGISRSPEPEDIFLPYMRSPHRNAFAFHQLDLNCDLPEITRLIGRLRPDVVVDFAGQGMVAESWSRPEQWYTTNITAKVRLHDYLRTCDWLRKYVRVSTPEVYGSCANLLKETTVYNPSTPYAVSHAAIDMSLMAFHRNYGFPVVFTRFANFFGPGQQLYRIIPKAILYMRSGKRLPLHGGGASIRSFLYVDDVAAGIWRAIEAGLAGEIYHFSTTEFPTIRRVVEMICDCMGVSFETATEIVPDRPGKDSAYLMDAGKARSELGWQPAVSLPEGIDRTVAWVDGSMETIRWLSWDYLHKE